MHKTGDVGGRVVYLPPVVTVVFVVHASTRRECTKQDTTTMFLAGRTGLDENNVDNAIQSFTVAKGEHTSSHSINNNGVSRRHERPRVEKHPLPVFDRFCLDVVYLKQVEPPITQTHRGGNVQR